MVVLYRIVLYYIVLALHCIVLNLLYCIVLYLYFICIVLYRIVLYIYIYIYIYCKHTGKEIQRRAGSFRFFGTRSVKHCAMDHPHGQTEERWDTSKFSWTCCRRCDTNFDPDPSGDLRDSLFWGNKRPKASRQIEHRTECVFVFVFYCIVL